MCSIVKELPTFNGCSGGHWGHVEFIDSDQDNGIKFKTTNVFRRRNNKEISLSGLLDDIHVASPFKKNPPACCAPFG